MLTLIKNARIHTMDDRRLWPRPLSSKTTGLSLWVLWKEPGGAVPPWPAGPGSGRQRPADAPRLNDSHMHFIHFAKG